MRGFLILAIVTLTLGCSSTRMTMITYEDGDVKHVTDSIQASGTVIGDWRDFYFNTEEDGMDPLSFSTLYDEKGNAKGSIQVRERDGKTEIKILDRRR